MSNDKKQVDPEIEQVWMEEVKNREKEVKEGKVEMISQEVFVQHLKEWKRENLTDQE